jgi:hypothetical protein
MGGLYSCPAEFVPAPSPLGCMIKCPTEKGYGLVSRGQVLACTYTADMSISVPVNVVPMYALSDPNNPAAPRLQRRLPFASLADGVTYKQEIERFNADLAVADAKIDAATKIRTAFVTLQNAENARGTPAGESAYQSARIAYYTLTKGDSWLQEEQTRIANTEAQPVVNTFTSQYQNLTQRKDQQQRTIDVINGLRDKVLSVKDDLSFSVNTFQKQVDSIKNKINIDKKNQIETIETTTSWIDTFLNWTIAIVTIVCIVMLVRRFSRGGPSLEKLKTDAALFRAQAEYTRAKAGLNAQPSMLSRV